MFRILRRRRLLAFGLIEVLFVSGIMTTMSSQTGGFRYAIDKAHEIEGVNNLHQIHMLLTTQCIGGALPNAAFYPQGDPKKDPKSILNLTEGAVPQLFVSPFAPEALKQKGLTFAWNDAVNGKDISLLPKDTWLLIDLAAFIADPAVPKPHRYLVLYADGRALALNSPPEDVVKAVREAQAKVEAAKKK